MVSHHKTFAYSVFSMQVVNIPKENFAKLYPHSSILPAFVFKLTCNYQ